MLPPACCDPYCVIPLTHHQGLSNGHAVSLRTTLLSAYEDFDAILHIGNRQLDGYSAAAFIAICIRLMSMRFEFEAPKLYDR